MAARGPISPRLAWSAEDPDATISISAQPMTAHDFPSFTARILTTPASCTSSTRYSPLTPPNALTPNPSRNCSFVLCLWRAPAMAAIFMPMSGQSGRSEHGNRIERCNQLDLVSDAGRHAAQTDHRAGYAGHDEEAMLEAVLAIVRDDAVCRRLDGAERRPLVAIAPSEISAAQCEVPHTSKVADEIII